MRTIKIRELRENMKHALISADREQEVLVVPSTNERDDIFIVPGKIYNRMAAKDKPFTMEEINKYLDIIDKQDSNLMKRLAE